MMHLLRSLHFLYTVHNIQVSAQHIPGADNVAADALSRNKLSEDINYTVNFRGH